MNPFVAILFAVLSRATTQTLSASSTLSTLSNRLVSPTSAFSTSHNAIPPSSHAISPRNATTKPTIAPTSVTVSKDVFTSNNANYEATPTFLSATVAPTGVLTTTIATSSRAVNESTGSMNETRTIGAFSTPRANISIIFIETTNAPTSTMFFSPQSTPTALPSASPSASTPSPVSTKVPKDEVQTRYLVVWLPVVATAAFLILVLAFASCYCRRRGKRSDRYDFSLANYYNTAKELKDPSPAPNGAHKAQVQSVPGFLEGQPASSV